MSIRLKGIVFYFLLMVVAFLGACGGPPTGEEGASQKGEDGEELTTVTVAQQIGIESLNPYAHSAVAYYAEWRHVIEPLVDYDYETNDYYGVLAEDWEIENDQDWIFHLREGIKFHDGEEFTSEDVVHSFNRIIEDPMSRQSGFFDNVTSIEEVDTYTVKIETEEPDSSFLKDLTTRYITSKVAYDEFAEEGTEPEHLIGTGPYTFKEWELGERFVVEKFDDYWGETNDLHVDRVIFRPIEEEAARVTALERGEVDIIPLPIQDIDRIEANEDLIVKEAEGLNVIMFVLNPAIEPLDDVKVRQAINYAINVDQITGSIMEDRVTQLGGPVGPNAFGYDPDWDAYPYDPEKAKKLLAEAGYGDGFDLEVYTSSGRYVRDLNISEAVVAQLQEVGINAELKTPEWGIFAEEMDQGMYGMYLVGRASVFDSSILLHQYFRTGVTNRTLYSNEEFDQLIDASQLEFDVDEREEMLQEAGSLLLADAAAVFLHSNNFYYGVSKRVEDWEPLLSEHILIGF